MTVDKVGGMLVAHLDLDREQENCFRECLSWMHQDLFKVRHGGKEESKLPSQFRETRRCRMPWLTWWDEIGASARRAAVIVLQGRVILH